MTGGGLLLLFEFDRDRDREVFFFFMASISFFIFCKSSLTDLRNSAFVLLYSWIVFISSFNNVSSSGPTIGGDGAERLVLVLVDLKLSISFKRLLITLLLVYWLAICLSMFIYVKKYKKNDLN